jgi:hypothetical protein
MRNNNAARRGLARLGWAWRGMARLGLARHGAARQGKARHYKKMNRTYRLDGET